MSTGRFDARLVQKPHQVPVVRRTLWGMVTLAFWVFYLYLWAPLVTVLSWLLGARLAWLRLYRYEQQLDPFVLVALPLICAGCAVLLIAWAEYNRYRFSRKDRRTPQPAASLEQVAQGLGVDPGLARQLSQARVATLVMDAQARPVEARVHSSDAG